VPMRLACRDECDVPGRDLVLLVTRRDDAGALGDDEDLVVCVCRRFRAPRLKATSTSRSSRLSLSMTVCASTSPMKMLFGGRLPPAVGG